VTRLETALETAARETAALASAAREARDALAELSQAFRSADPRYRLCVRTCIALAVALEFAGVGGPAIARLHSRPPLEDAATKTRATRKGFARRHR
jgi:hypothetical protein